MSKLSPRPQNINSDTWYYEDKSGIEMYHRVYNRDGTLFKTEIIKIPWHKLLNSLKRKGAP